MFSGIVEEYVEVVRVVKELENLHLTLKCSFVDELKTDQSISHNGVCLTVVSIQDGTYTVTISKLDDSTVLKNVAGLELNKALFVNELGQTFFSTAIYEGAGCDGNHWEHREVCVYSVKAYTKDAAAAVVTLEQDSYEFEEGTTYKPAVTVTLNGKTLVDNTDYYVEWVDNKAVGTASVYVYFIGEYAGNEKAVKTFTITEAQPENPGSDTTDTGSSEPTTSEPETNGCVAGMGFASLAISFAALAGAVVIKRRKN